MNFIAISWTPSRVPRGLAEDARDNEDPPGLVE